MRMPDFEITLLHQTADLIAVDKPPGLSIHNVEDPENLLSLLQKQKGVAKLYPVHRLDKETSGVQILATNESAAKRLALEFQSRAVTKIYMGVLRGLMTATQGVWAQPLTDKSEGRRNPAGLAAQRVPCETWFRVLESSNYFSLCEFNLITGRQHQIRKHAALAKHALVGDARYGDEKYNAQIAEKYNHDRMFLHCSQITISGATHVSAPPVSFKDLLAGVS
jgi:RluA family pseudouridine synthase